MKIKPFKSRIRTIDHVVCEYTYQHRAKDGLDGGKLREKSIIFMDKASEVQKGGDMPSFGSNSIEEDKELRYLEKQSRKET